MDPLRNPFSPGAGSRPPELAGRENLLQEARIALGRVVTGRSAQSILLLGLRGTGKTVLLNEIEAIAESDYLTSLIEAPDGKPLAELLYPQIRQMLRKLSIVEKARVHANRALGGLRNFAAAFKITVGEVEIGVEPTLGVADSGDLELDLTELFVLLGRAAKEAGKGWCLLIDEVQYLSSPELSALITAIHRANQKSLPIIVIGAGLPQIARLTGDAKSYSERLFSYPAVGALNDDAAKAAIKVPLEKEGVEITTEALEIIIRNTRGYPFFLQEWGHHCWNIAQHTPIDQGVVDRAGERALERLDSGFFRVRMDRLTKAETEYVYAMAKLGVGPYRSTDVANELGKEATSLGPRRASIISKGMIYSPSYGDIDFTVPLFDEYLRRTASRALT